jgi:hypothetical protein
MVISLDLYEESGVCVSHLETDLSVGYRVFESCYIVAAKFCSHLGCKEWMRCIDVLLRVKWEL